MSLRELLMTLFGRGQRVDDPAHVALDAKQTSLAARLARLKGVTRDEVLAEAYRRADRTLAEHR